MRDLKHLIFFEDLLQDANNALVQQACAQGKLALAYNCSYIPEVLLDVEGCFGIRLRGSALHQSRPCHLLHDQPLLPLFQEYSGAGL